ncbi:hypothetical protein DFH09DRAFT_1109800 [Mycena vulgaris]|nr:hypothetical protein DFH09DRAFT_1109800 [Mycena vulgaris]
MGAKMGASFSFIVLEVDGTNSQSSRLLYRAVLLRNAYIVDALVGILEAYTNDDRTTLKRCSRCRLAWYCSSQCQKIDWKARKRFCGKANFDQEVVAADPEKPDDFIGCLKAVQGFVLTYPVNSTAPRPLTAFYKALVSIACVLSFNLSFLSSSSASEAVQPVLIVADCFCDPDVEFPREYASSYGMILGPCYIRSAGPRDQHGQARTIITIDLHRPRTRGKPGIYGFWRQHPRILAWLHRSDEASSME